MSDLDVIEGAADKQMAFVRQYQSGEHAAAAAKTLLVLFQPRINHRFDGIQHRTRSGYCQLIPRWRNLLDRLVDRFAGESQMPGDLAF